MYYPVPMFDLTYQTCVLASSSAKFARDSSDSVRDKLMPPKTPAVRATVPPTPTVQSQDRSQQFLDSLTGI